MFLRREAFDEIGGFSARFFLYFEDFDLSIRIREAGWDIAYVPTAVITHHGGSASRKGLRHIFMFTSSAISFFNRHGWKMF
jgi:GT2 family glycosyltransferase